MNDTVIGNQLVGRTTVPIIGTEQLTTTVTVPTGNTIVIGGLISEQFKTDTEGIPILRPHSRSRAGSSARTSPASKRKELIIFIQPMVVTDDFAMRQASMNEDLRTKAGRGLPITPSRKRWCPRPWRCEDPGIPPLKRKWYEIFKRPKASPAPAREERDDNYNRNADVGSAAK